jgi:glycosyltransferase involved in cell wall biosynthesis
MNAFAHRIWAGITRRVRWLFEPVPGAVFSMRASLTSRPTLVYVSDGAGWVLDEIGQTLTRRIDNHYLMRVGRSYRGYRGVTLHFAASSLYLKRKPFLSAHPSNRLLFTWSHGLPSNPDPNIQTQISHLSEGVSYARRIHVWTTTARDFLIGQGVAPEKIVLVPLGVDTGVFHPPTSAERAAARARLGVPENAICIGSFQKDSPGWDNTSHEMKWVKGPDVLADVIKQLAERHPLFVLLTSPSRGYLIERLKRAGIPYRHDVLSNLAELAPYYHALDLYLITSRDEGGPMALLEAMASGVPVVSTRMGIPKDAIRHGENGMLADLEDVEGLVAAARSLLDDPGLAAEIAVTARRTALAYDWSVIADKYARLLYNFTS